VVKSTPWPVVPLIPLSLVTLLIFQSFESLLQAQGLIGTQNGFTLAFPTASVAKYEITHVVMRTSGGTDLHNGKMDLWYQAMREYEK